MIKRLLWLLVICCWLFSSQVYAALWLRQSTAVTVKIGPFLDSTDGDAEEVSLTISQADIRLSKNGGAYAQTNNVAGATHDENGIYGVPLNTTDTGTLGRLKVYIHESGALAVWEYFMVVPANVWDSMFGVDKLQVDTTEIENSDATTYYESRSLATADYFIASSDPVEIRESGGVVGANAEELVNAIWDEPRGAHTTGNTFGGDALDNDTWTDTRAEYLDALNGHTAQTGDTYALANSGTYGFSVLEALVDDIGVAGAGLTAINLPNQVMDISGNITGNLSGSVGSVSADVTTDSASRTASKADVSGLSTHDAAAIWAVVTRILTASTNFNDISTAQVNTEVDNAIVTYKLDHLVYAADGDDPVNDSIMAMLAATGGDWSTFVKGTDSLQAIRDRGDAAWTTATTVGLSDNAITAAKVHANAWQELIELFFDFDATATYATANAGSVVRQIADNARVAAAITTTVATANTTTSFTLTAGTTEDDAYEKMQITVTDANGKTSTETRRITAWTSGRVVTVDTAFSFTPAASDIVIVERAYLGVSATATIPPRIY